MKKLSPRDLRRLLKRADINIEEFKDVYKVTIEFISGKKITISNPVVTKMRVAGQTTYQVIGEETVEDEITINDEDIKIIMEQTGVDEETAKNTLIMTKGDIAEAILMLKGEK